MSKKNKKLDQSKFALRQVAENEELQRHLRTASVRLGEAWQRASGRPASAAVEDKKLYDKVREAATSIARAAKLMASEPEPPKRRGRTLLVLATAAGTTIFVLRKRNQAREPDAAPPPAPPVAPTPNTSPTRSAA